MALNIFAVLSLILLYKYKKSLYKPIYCQAIFVLMWFLFSVEFYTTQDYGIYYEHFNDKFVWDEWEPLYALLVKASQPLGFIVFNSFVCAFNIFTLYYIFKLFIPSRVQWIGIIMFIFSLSRMMYLMTYKRQFFAMMVAFWILYFLIFSQYKYRYVIAFICFLCAINIHSSAYISILYFSVPFLSSYMYKKFFGNIVIIIFVFMFVASYIFSLSSFSDSLSYIISAYSYNADHYDRYVLEQLVYENEDRKTSTIGFIFDLGCIYLMLKNFNNFKDSQSSIVLLSLAGFLFSNIFLGSFHRLTLYFNIYLCISFPLLIDLLSHYNEKGVAQFIKKFLIILCLFISCRDFVGVMYLGKEVFMAEKYSVFYTVFHDNVDKSVNSLP